MIVLAGEISFKPEFREEGLRACEAMLAPSRAEPGCLSHRFFEDPLLPGTILFFEEWRSRQDLDDHFAMEPFQKFAEQVGSWSAASPRIRIYSVSEHEDL
ncbi:MAG TPA: putative quinol monooxygenase [Fimbriimonadaceae bacterium]|nr:putative quinol monooxygenase [Fimbriimonadaceae bacterium]HRJ33531.1 putative quinol monooxygenase [Fimbriimonadaceae bacterium]